MSDRVSLFAEMDAAAAAMPAPDRDDLQIEFRAILLARGEATDQWLKLFDRWFEHHVGSIRSRRAEAHARVSAFIAQAAGTLPPGDPYRCPCGEVIYSWSPWSACTPSTSTMGSSTDRGAKAWDADAPLHLSARRGVVISPTFLGGIG